MLCGGWAFWLIAMMKVICCKFSQSRWRIDRRCFLRSFSAKARRALERVISKPCSKPSSASKPREEIYDFVMLSEAKHLRLGQRFFATLRMTIYNRRIDNAVLPKARRNAEEAPHLVQSQWSGADLQE